QHSGSNEDCDGAEPDEQDRRCGQSRHQSGDANDRRKAADRATPPKRSRLLLAGLDERGDGGDPHRAPGRADRRDHGDPDPNRERDHNRASLEHQRRCRQCHAEGPKQRLQGAAGEHAQPQSDQEAASPTRTASPSTAANTWRRLAPTMRSSASSRVRCPTVIEKVLKIVKAPTNSEIRANTNSTVDRKESALLTALESSPATVCPL